MSDHLKRAVQKVLVKRRHRLYRRRIAEQAIPYGVWLENMQEQESADIAEWKKEQEKAGKEGLSVSILTREMFCESVFDREEREKKGDIWLVTTDPSRLTKNAVWEVERYFLENPSYSIAYGDESDYFKPGWSPDLLQSFFYFGNVFAVRKTLIAAIAGKPGKEEDLKKRLYSIVLCCMDEAKVAGRMEKLLFIAVKREERKRRVPKYDDIPKQYQDWGRESDFDGIKRGHLYSDIEIPTEREEQKLVSVIIPSKDNPAVLSKCIHSLREQTDYHNIEIIVIDNGSNDKNRAKVEQINDQLKVEYGFRYIYKPMSFNFSAMCNMGAKEANGEYLLFLNDDIEIVEENWLRLMLSRAAKSYVGAVGAKLLYPDSDRIQHVGVTSIHLGPAHELQFAMDREVHYHGYNRCAVNASAVTGACMLMRRDVFERTKGFSEKLQVAYNDVEFCFQLLRLGYVNVCCNDTFLYHHESLSRGLDEGFEKLARLHGEGNFLYETYPEMWNGDRYYSRKLVTDILDGGFMPACRFEEKTMSRRSEAIPIEKEMKEEWHNEILYMGIEFTGDRCAWETGRHGGGDYYIQGWSFAVNVDNSRYKKNLLLRSMDAQDGGLWKIPYEERYRPDMEDKLTHVNRPALCGVSVWIARDALPAGKYMIGFLWEDTCSRQKLYKFTPETMTVHDRTEECCGV